jgi:hypothetical protein
MTEKLVVWWTWRQVDGGARYALDTPREAARLRREVSGDPAMAEALAGDFLVDREGGRLVAYEWPGRLRGEKPPWAAIKRALRDRGA